MADPKMVPESDLIAAKESLKESHAGEISKLTETHEAAITDLNKEHTGLSDGLQSQLRTATEDASRLRATNTQLEEANKNGTATAEELKGLKNQLKVAEDTLSTTMETVAKDLRSGLIDEFKIQEKALEGKTVAELTVIKDALATTRGPDSRQFTGGGGSGGTPVKTGRALIREGLDAGNLKPQ